MYKAKLVVFPRRARKVKVMLKSSVVNLRIVTTFYLFHYPQSMKVGNYKVQDLYVPISFAGWRF